MRTYYVSWPWCKVNYEYIGQFSVSFCLIQWAQTISVRITTNTTNTTHARGHTKLCIDVALFAIKKKMATLYTLPNCTCNNNAYYIVIVISFAWKYFRVISIRLLYPTNYRTLQFCALLKWIMFNTSIRIILWKQYTISFTT